MNTIKNTLKLVIALIMMMGGLAFMAPAANAEGRNPVKLTVTASSVDEASIKDSFTTKNETRALINGATQVTWEDSDHDLKVTKREIRKAPKFKIKATGANSSAKIYKKAKRKNNGKAAKVVVLKKGSEIRNTGRENMLRVGFNFTLPHDTVVVLDKKSKQYRIAYSIIGGKLKKTKECGNFIGGNVPMRDKVVQVRYEQDVLMDAEGEVVSKAAVNLTLSVKCPTSTFTVNTMAEGRGDATGSLSYTERTRVNVTEAKKVSLSQAARGEIKLNAESSALARITVEYDCGSTPPPPPVVYDSPDVEVAPVACVEPGQSRSATVTVSNPNNNPDTVRLTYRGVVQADKPIAAHGQVTFTFANQAAGSYSGTALLVSADKSKPFTFVVEECPPVVEENKPPTGEIVQWPAHLEPGEYYKLKFVGSDPEDGGSVELEYSVSGGAVIVEGDANHPTICDIEGSQKVCTFWIRANASTGVEYELNLRVYDGEGKFFDAVPKSGMVQNLPV